MGTSLSSRFSILYSRSILPILILILPCTPVQPSDFPPSDFRSVHFSPSLLLFGMAGWLGSPIRTGARDRVRSFDPSHRIASHRTDRGEREREGAREGRREKGEGGRKRDGAACPPHRTVPRTARMHAPHANIRGASSLVRWFCASVLLCFYWGSWKLGVRFRAGRKGRMEAGKPQTKRSAGVLAVVPWLSCHSDFRQPALWHHHVLYLKIRSSHPPTPRAGVNGGYYITYWMDGTHSLELTVRPWSLGGFAKIGIE
jgi:hypothetical protein